MIRIAYLECPTGIAGDMCLGALVDLGVPLAYLTEQLERLGIAREYQLRVEQVHRNGQRATKFRVELLDAAGGAVNPDVFTTFDHAAHHSIHSATSASVPAGNGDVHLDGDHNPPHPSHPPHPSADPPHDHEHHPVPIRHLSEIERLIISAKLPERAEAWSLAVFRKLAEAEGAVHGVPMEQVHFHEVGATDAIVDIVGTCLGLDWLGIDQLYCSALPVGGGTVRAAHGRLPVPSPATLKLFEMRQIPIYSNGIERELVTPTGAAIATTLATQFGPPPAMVLQQVGLGAGSQNLLLPNILRLWVGEGSGEMGRWGGGEIRRHKAVSLPHAPHSSLLTPHSSPPSTETIAVLETQIDDLNPQAIGYVFEALLNAGALDVFTQAIAMKKSRSGVLLTVICQPEKIAVCEAVIFRETTTLGIRRSFQERQILAREIQSVQTEYGAVRVKVAWSDPHPSENTEMGNHSPMNVQPEYEDCAQIARERQIPWREVHRAALQGWYQGKG